MPAEAVARVNKVSDDRCLEKWGDPGGRPCGGGSIRDFLPELLEGCRSFGYIDFAHGVREGAISTYARYRALAEEAGKLFEGASQTGWGGPAICPGQFPALVWLKYVFDVRSPPICPFDGYEMAVIEDLELHSEIAIRHLLAQIPATAPPSGQDGKADDAMAMRVAALERQQTKTPKPLTKREKNRKQRNGFSCKRRTKKTPDTWAEIYNAYNKKYPKDKDASPDTLRLSHDRNCTKCRKDKS